MRIAPTCTMLHLPPVADGAAAVAPAPHLGRAAAPPPAPDDLLCRVMSQLVADADADATQRSSGIRQRCADATRARMRVLAEVRKQARASRRARVMKRFKKFLLGVAAALGAAAAIVAAPFTGGGSAAAYAGAALGIASACAGGAAAGGGIAAGRLDARAAMAGLKGELASSDLASSLDAMKREAMQSEGLVEVLASPEQRAMEVLEKEERLAQAATRSRTW